MHVRYRARLENLLGDKLARRFLGDAGIALALRVTWAVLNYIAVLLLARWMLPVEYGRFALVLSILRPASILAGLGADTSVLRFIGQYRGQTRSGAIKAVITYAIWATSIASVFVTALLIGAFWTLARFGPVDAPLVYAVGLLLIPFYTISGVLGAIARSFGHVILALAPRDVLWRAALIPLGWAAVYLSGTEQQALALLAGSVICLAMLTALQYIWMAVKLPEHVCDALPEPDAVEWRRVTKPIWISAIAVGIIGNADVLIVGAFVDEIAAGRYFAIQRTAMLVTFMQVSANLIIGPEAARLYHANKIGQLQRLLKLAATMIFVPSFCALALFALFGEPILSLFGQDFVEYKSELLILAIGQAVSAAVGCVGILLAMTGHEKFLSRVQVGATLLALAVILVGTWQFGTIGAAVGTALGISLRNLVVWVYARRNLPVEASILSLIARKR